MNVARTVKAAGVVKRRRSCVAGVALVFTLLTAACGQSGSTVDEQLAANSQNGNPESANESAEQADSANEAPPWAELPDGSTLVGPEFRGWTEWPFGDVVDRNRTDLAISRFETDQRIVFLNVMMCAPKSDFTRAYGWGLTDADGELLNTGYTTLTLDWLEAPYRQPAEGSCGEGWVGVPIDPSAEPVEVVWADTWNSTEQTWPIGAPITPTAVEPVTAELSVVGFGEEGEASNGAYWTVLDLVAVSAQDSQTPPPLGTDWWVAEAQYCAPPGEDTIWDGLQLAVDGWYVFNSSGREIDLDPAHPPQTAAPPGGCGMIWETFALPQGLQPSHVRLRTDQSTTVWVR